MIVKNEERYLAECLQSVQGVADEIVIVDTGSTDATIDIAKGFGAKVFHYAWSGDFAAARNDSLKHCTGDWILQLDADEELRVEDKQTLRELIEHPVADGYVVALASKVRGGDNLIPAVSRAARLFRRRPGFQFRGMIHESVIDEVLNHGGVILPAELTLIHKGYSGSDDEIQKKKHRNLEVLLRQAERSPDDFYTLLKLGETQLALDHIPEAEQAINHALQLLNAGKVAARDNLRVAQIFILKALVHVKQRQFDEAEIAARNSLTIVPRQSMGHSLLSHIFEEEGRITEAIAEVRILLNPPPLPPDDPPLEADVENEREELHYRLARLLAIANDRAASTQALVLAREINPRYLPVLVSLGGVFAEDGKLDEALECINDAKRVSAAEPKLSLLRAQLLVCLQRPDEAMEELKLSFSRGILTEEGLSLLTKLVTERGGEVDPIPYLRTLVEYRPSALDARFSLVQALIAQEQFSDALHELNIALSLSPNETLRGMFLALRWKIESFLHEVAR